MLNEHYYTRYLNFIQARIDRPKPDCYTEQHHIWPKSLGGLDTGLNIIALTSREHYIAHWLLSKCFTYEPYKQKMLCAFAYMLTRKGLTARQYERARLAVAGELNPMYGKSHSEETKQKLSAIKLAYYAENPEAKPIGAKKGKPLSAEHKQALSESAKGRKLSDETKLKMSLARRAYYDSKKA